MVQRFKLFTNVNASLVSTASMSKTSFSHKDSQGLDISYYPGVKNAFFYISLHGKAIFHTNHTPHYVRDIIEQKK